MPYLTETENQRLLDASAKQSDEIDRLRLFVEFCLREGSFAGCDVDGGAAQDVAQRLRLIKPEPYDPKKHGDWDGEPGDNWFTFTWSPDRDGENNA